MKRLLVALAVVVCLLVPGPANAQTEPAGTISGTGWTCSYTQQRPYHAVISGAHRLRAVMTIRCDPVGSYSLVQLLGRGRMGQSGGGGVWGPYSNVEENRIDTWGSGPVWLSFAWNPAQDGCNWNTEWRYYRWRVEVDLAVHSNASGSTSSYGFIVYLPTLDRIPCGDHE